MKRIVLLGTLAALGLMGCANQKAPYVDLSSYQDGFKHGCESGVWYDLSKIKHKDYQRAMNDRGYFHGWDEGFSECRYNIYYGDKDKTAPWRS